MLKVLPPHYLNAGKPAALDPTLPGDASEFAPLQDLSSSSDSASASTAGAGSALTSFGGAATEAFALPVARASAAAAVAPTQGSGSGGGSASLTFDNSPSTFTLSSEYQNCIQAAENFLSTVFKPINSVTASVSFDEKALGKNGYFLTNDNGSYHDTTFATLEAALPTSDVLPSADPGDDSSWWVPGAYGRMLGISTYTPPAGSFDSEVHLNSDDPWNFGQDVITGLIHELSEGVMGRVSSLGQPGGGNTVSWTTMDLFRYTATGYDVQNGADGLAAYFSSDGGKTENTNFELNDQKGSSTLGAPSVDAGDWIGNNAVFGGVAPGSTLNLAPVELGVMQALGWSVQMPEDFMEASGSWQDPTTWSMACMPIADPEDAYIGGLPNVVTATLGSNAAVNSIGVQAGDTLEIESNYTLTAWNGTQINSATVGATMSGNAGAIYVDGAAGLEIGGAFYNSGVLTVGASQPGNLLPGFLNLGGSTPVVFSGGGHVHLGAAIAGGGYSSAQINGSAGFINVDNTIDGDASITVSTFDNQAAGTIIATVDKGGAYLGPYLEIDAPTSANEGLIDVAANARLALGNFGASTFNNSGDINVGWDGANAGSGAQLEVDGALTISGAGSLLLRGAGAEITSGYFDSSTLVNNSNLNIQASAQIGDFGIYNGVNNLTFVNRGQLKAYGAGVVAVLNTGAIAIDDGGGLLEAVGAATLNIMSNVTTGRSYANGGVAQPGGTIEAITGGKINLSAAISAGPAAPAGHTLASGKVVVQYTGNLTIQSGGSISVPLSIYGPAAQFGAGIVTVQSGGALTGPVTFASVGGKLNLTGVATAIEASGKGGVVSLTSSKVNLSGGSETVTFVGAGDVATLSNTAGAWDAVTGSNGTIAVNGAETNVTGGADVVNATAGSKVSLYNTSGAWDNVNGSGLQANVNAAQASIVGGGETIYATAGSKLSLYSTSGNWDAVNGSGAQINLTTAQAAITGGLNTVYANTGSSISLFGANGNWDGVYASGDQIVLVAAQAAITGGSDAVYANSASSMSLFGTNGHWDAVFGSGDKITLTAAQSSITGGSNTIYANSSSSVSLYGTNGKWDTVNGSNEQVLLTSSQANIVGGGNKISASSGSSLSLYNTSGTADTVAATSDSLILNNAQASLTGDSDGVTSAGSCALTVSGSHETFNFAKALGLVSIIGFNTSDVLHLSTADWSSFAALQASHDLKQSGANVQITTDASDTITLVNAKVDTLTAAQFAFA